MPVVLVLAALVILAGVVAVATGRGGELSRPLADSAAYGRDLATAADVAAFRPPAAFLGYSAQATDQALDQIARVVADRDAELAMLRRENAVLRARQAAPQPPPPQPFAAPGPAEFTSPSWQLAPEDPDGAGDSNGTNNRDETDRTADTGPGTEQP
jgi:hypothetical protein